MRTLVIIPAYNEESNIKKTIEKLKEYHQNFDYIVINDCSTDHTRKICEQYQYNHINLPINLGIGGAFRQVISMPGRTITMRLFKWTAMASMTPPI